MEAFRAQPARGNDNPAWRQLKPSVDGLIVAIGYASGQTFDVDARAIDYTPATAASTGDFLSPQHGGADAFLRFITEELRPLIAQHFVLNTQQQTLFGFSYGGLFALHTLSTQPQHFQRYWAASPSLWFGEHQTIFRLPQQLAQQDFSQHPVQVQITVGLDEQYPATFATPELEQKLTARKMVDNATQFAHGLREHDAINVQLNFQALAAHDHQDMLLHGARRVLAFAFAPT
jgi:predicted alpha/beta superfamily hydrolase